MRILGAGVRRTAYALHARNLRLRRLHLGYASVPMSCIGILYYKCILSSVLYIIYGFLHDFGPLLDSLSISAFFLGLLEFSPFSGDLPGLRRFATLFNILSRIWTVFIQPTWFRPFCSRMSRIQPFWGKRLNKGPNICAKPILAVSGSQKTSISRVYIA